MKEKLLITTLPPAYYGGILSMMSAVYDITSNDFKPTLAFASERRFSNNKILNILLKIFKGDSYNEEFRGMNCISVDCGICIHDALNYVDIKGKWSNVLDEYDKFFCVGGSAHSALPLMKNKKEYSIWIATPYLDDRIDRQKKFTILQKTLEFIFLKIAIKQEEKILKNAAHILALSKYTKQKLIEYYNISSDTIKVVPYPIDVDEFVPMYEKRSTNRKQIIFTARYNDPRKNTQMLIRAHQKVLRNISNVKLILIGENPSEDLKELVHKLHISEHVEFINRLNKESLVEYYQSSDVFVLPSNQEGLCISALEGLSCGLPIVSTKCGGPEEFVLKSNGFLTPLDDSDVFSERIIEILSNSNLQNKMSEASRKLIRDKYSKQKISKLFLDVIKESGETEKKIE